MLDEIIKLIEEKKYPAAIKEADAEFERLIFTNRLDTDHEACEKVLAYRVIANTLAGNTDDLVYHNVWKLRFPHKESVELFPGRQVHLLDMNVLLFKCDAWINVFHENKYFDYSERSFSHTLIHRVPKEEIANAINLQKDFIKRGFLVLEHQGLITKRSYHIPAVVTNENEIDLTRLSFGLKEALKYSKDMKHKTVGIPAIGMATNPSMGKKRAIISCIAETLKEFFIENRKKEIPEIYFPFVNINSFQIFKEIFYSFSLHGQYLTNINKKLTETQQKLIEVSRSKNPKFIKRLERLAYEINEDSTILILGETGVGKSYIAEEIHKLSNRELIKFRALNCGSIIPQDLHTEIFGFDPKSYTNVKGNGDSIFEVCEGGTVFLDEITNANLFVQQSLLTFLDKKNIKKEECLRFSQLMLGLFLVQIKI